MPQTIEFFVPWTVAPKQTKGNQIATAANGKQFVRNFTPADVRDNERQLLTMLEKHKPEQPMRGPVRASYSFRYAWRSGDMCKPRGETTPRPKYDRPLPKDTKPDLGNCIKQIEDCLERGGFVVNDSQIAAYGSVEKVWTDVPGVWIRLETMTQEKTNGREDEATAGQRLHLPQAQGGSAGEVRGDPREGEGVRRACG